MKTTFNFGVVAALFCLPMMGLAFIIGKSAFWLYLAGFALGAAGLFFIALAIFLKLASLLFRA